MSTELTGSAGAGNGEGAAAGAGSAGASGNVGVQGTPGAGSNAAPVDAGAKKWQDSLPEDLRGNGMLAQFSDVGTLAKSYVHAQSLIGKKGVIVPGEKATDEEWAGFYKAIGQPDADNFEIKLPDGNKVNAEFAKEFKEMTHKVGLLPKQAQGMMDWYLGNEKKFTDEAMKGLQAEQAKGIEGLKTEWGQGYTKQISLAQAAVRELGGPDLIKHLNDTGFGNDPQLIRLMAKAGALLGEDKIRGAGEGQFGKTPDEVRREINEIMGNQQHPYFDKAHPAHKQAVDDMALRYRALG